MPEGLKEEQSTVLEAAQLGELVAAELGPLGQFDFGHDEKLVANALPEGGDVESAVGRHVIAADNQGRTSAG